MLLGSVLIETYWNVKTLGFLLLLGYFSINRNILECKGNKYVYQNRTKPVLIETYWNVKSGADPLTVNSLRY